ncbi:Aldo/keto reductase [Rhizodiscina lignyota]|uniref:Aldo/keto reductase n=1 Tax=Rhizodiscina lignyota TaxID=1504668 RepID=A0A9P4IFW1_9PEZI|nr:Aldo/keto reductase [Rhizodiscina lignyota]
MAAKKNRIILGLANVGPNTTWGAKVTSLDDFNKELDIFKANGYDELDTARMYQEGQQEGFTGKSGWKEKGFKIGTKAMYPLKPQSSTPAGIRANIEESLKELKTDFVDIFYLHAPDRSLPFEQTLSAVNDLYDEGKFRQFGLSNFASFEVAEVVLTCQAKGWVLPTVYQGMYNALTRGLEGELMTACRSLAGGLFTGKYNANKTEAPANPTAVDRTYRARFVRETSLEALAVIESATKKHGLTLIETAIRWLQHHSALKMRTNGGNDGFLIGASNIGQLESYMRELEKGPLPEDVVNAIDEAWLISKQGAPNYWHLTLGYGYDTQKELFGK